MHWIPHTSIHIKRLRVQVFIPFIANCDYKNFGVRWRPSWIFPRKHLRKNWKQFFCQSFRVNISEKSQLFKIYMKKSQNMYLLHNSVYYTRLRGDQIDFLKISNGYENIDSNIFFKLKEDSMTRGHTAVLVKIYCRLDTRKYSFQKTINTWNKLSHDCVNASSVNMLKNTIYSYLAISGYT